MSKTIATLEQERAARLDYGDLPLSTARRDADTYVAQTAELDGRISVARNAQLALVALEAQIAPEMKWHDFLTKTRDRLVKVLLGLSKEPRGRVTWDREHAYKFSIICIDKGCEHFPNGAPMLPKPLADAIEDAGFTSETPGPAWFGSIAQVAGRIADRQVRLDAAQAALDEALLDDDARSQRDAEGAARVAKLNAAPVRKTRGDHSQFDRWPDGRIVEVTS
jgi:hypothetical protein